MQAPLTSHTNSGSVLWIVRMSEQVEDLLGIHPLLFEMRGGQKLAVSLMRPTEPVWPSGSEQSGIKRLA